MIEGGDSPTIDQLLPPLLEKHLKEIGSFQKRCFDLCQRLLEAFALALNQPLTYFTDQHVFGASNPSALRLLHYPPIAAEKPGSRAGVHSDYGSLTLLFQRRVEGGGGLQVFPPDAPLSDDAWVDIPVLENAVLVNIGDAFEFWTGCQLKSTLHRVVGPPDGSNTDRFTLYRTVTKQDWKERAYSQAPW